MDNIKALFSLHAGEENKEVVLNNIKDNIPFKGANLWILACAIIVASVGLNVNSTAVIIGAMLISPLMGPIVGAGFALGRYDFVLLRQSLSSLLLATVVALAVSAFYFYITPYKAPQPELIARTAPNIYDVLIAFFGGLVGVIAVTRVEKGNPVPGVAIATALMPPLCTAGYGLAVGNWAYFGGALFLYAINCTFICIATYFIVKLLRYPPVKQLNHKAMRGVQLAITLLVLLLIAPSIYFAYTFIQKEKFENAANDFIVNEMEQGGRTVIYKKTDYSASPKKIELALLTKKYTSAEVQGLNQKLLKYGLNDTRLIIRQDTAFYKQNAATLKPAENVADANIIALKKELDSYRFNDEDLYKEAVVIFPTVTSISAGRQNIYNADTVTTMPVVLYEAKQPLTKPELAKMQQWLRLKLHTDSLQLIKKNKN